MKKIFAIPVEDGLLATHFGHCNQFSFIEVIDDKVKFESKLTPPPHEPGVLPKWIAEQGTTDVIAGGLGQKAKELLEMNKITVLIGAPVKRPIDLVEDFLNGKLSLGNNACSH